MKTLLFLLLSIAASINYIQASDKLRTTLAQMQKVLRQTVRLNTKLINALVLTKEQTSRQAPCFLCSSVRLGKGHFPKCFLGDPEKVCVLYPCAPCPWKAAPPEQNK